jgi:hypothetical protein
VQEIRKNKKVVVPANRTLLSGRSAEKKTAQSYQRDKQRAGVVISTFGLLFQELTVWQSIPSTGMATNNTDLEELKKNVDHVFIMTNAIIVCCKFASFIPYVARLYV